MLFIDEAQFLPDLKDFCKEVARSKRVYVAGLDLDYRKERFGQVRLQPQQPIPHQIMEVPECGKHS